MNIKESVQLKKKVVQPVLVGTFPKTKNNNGEIDLAEEIAILKTRVDGIETLLTLVLKQLKQSHNAYEPIKVPREITVANLNLNKDNIPVNTVLIGVSRGQSYFLYVNKDHYTVGDKTYASLSSAAEAVSGCRRSGWVFWKTVDGRESGDVYRRRD